MSRGVKQSRRRFLATSLVTLAAPPLGTLACSDPRSSGTPAAAPSTVKDTNPMQQITHPAIPLANEGTAWS